MGRNFQLNASISVNYQSSRIWVEISSFSSLLPTKIISHYLITTTVGNINFISSSQNMNGGFVSPVWAAPRWTSSIHMPGKKRCQIAFYIRRRITITWFLFVAILVLISRNCMIFFRWSSKNNFPQRLYFLNNRIRAYNFLNQFYPS